MCGFWGGSVIGDSSSQVVVDLAEVRDVIDWLHRESELLAQERSSLHPCVHFGAQSPCGETNAARRSLVSALDGYEGNTDRHRHHIETLTAAFEQVLEQYATADAGNSANLRKHQQ